MPTAPIAAIRQPQQVQLGTALAVHCLATLGVTIRHVDLPAEKVGVFDEATGILRVRADAEPDDQAWLLHQVWSWLAIGPHATVGKVEPLLHLVLPRQRTPDELPA